MTDEMQNGVGGGGSYPAPKACTHIAIVWSIWAYESTGSPVRWVCFDGLRLCVLVFLTSEYLYNLTLQLAASQSFVVTIPALLALWIEG